MELAMRSKHSLIGCAVAFAMIGASCGSGPKLSDHFSPEDISHRPPLEAMLKAPIVVVGWISAARIVGGVRTSSVIPGMKIELLKIEVEVENLLKGDVPGSEITVYYFVISPHNNKSVAIYPYTSEAGERRMFFLRNESGVIRPVGDVNDYTLGVASGSHKGLEAKPGASLGEKISWILLTPGRRFRPRPFATYLSESRAVAMSVCSESCTQALLRQLLTNDNEAVRNAASRQILALRR